MSTTARRRLIVDFKGLQTDSPIGVSAAPSEDNILHWTAVLFGPEGTPWEGGTFRLHFEFTEEYPTKPPKVVFKTKVFHPNVYHSGDICLDILQKKWSSQYNVGSILMSIQALLCDPNPDSPANPEAARLFSDEKAEYLKRVKNSVENSWLYEDG